MLGRDIAFFGSTNLEEIRPQGEVLLEFNGYGRKCSVHPFDLTIRQGEVVGVAGLPGSGAPVPIWPIRNCLRLPVSC